MPKLALGAVVALAALSFSPGSAQAYVVTVGQLQYDVTTFTGQYNSNTSKFQTAANGGGMPWWNSTALAQQFATALGTSLGIVNTCSLAINCGPLFSYSRRPGFVVPFLENWRFDQSASGGVGGVLPDNSVDGRAFRSWAQATLYDAPASDASAPAPLPLFGAGAAFGFSRKLRKRIKLTPAALGSSLPLA